MDKNHKTLYKQLILSLSKCEDYIGLNSIPLLIDDKYCTSDTNIWFADRNSKRYMHYFNTLDFILFDIETNKDFVKHFGIQLFKPAFELKPDSAKETIQSKLKQIIENKYLTNIFCLADEIMHINRFNKEEAITRWNNLKIGYAEDVWLEINLDYTKEIVTVGKELKNNDVFFKPLSDSQRQNNKENIGDIVHDLKGAPAHIMQNPKFYKFGYVIADGVFRDTALGSVLSDYLKTEDKDEFLKERGIIDSDIKEMENFIKQSILDKNEVEIIVNELSNLFKSDINTSNWFVLNTYTEFDTTYEDIKSLFENSEKLQNAIKQLNPINYNKSKVNKLKDEIKLKYYILHGKQLRDEDFDQMLIEFNDQLIHYNLDNDVIMRHFGIDREINEDQLLIAQIEIENDIKVEISGGSNNKNTKINELKQFCTAKQTNTKKIREEQRLETSNKQQKRGLAYEKIFAIQQAKKIFCDDELIGKFKDKYNEIPDLDKNVNFMMF